MIWGCCYNNLPHTWNFTHNLKNSEEATFHYYLKLCLVSEPGHWVIIFFIKASNYLMNSMIILHLGVYFGWRYSFIKCKHLMLTLTLYKKKKVLEEAHFSSGHKLELFVSRRSRSLYWVISSRDISGGYSLGQWNRRILLEVRQAWVLGPFVAMLQCLYLDTPFLEQQRNYMGLKWTMCIVSWDKFWTRAAKRFRKTPNCNF